MIADQMLPPPLVHELRSRSFPRLLRMTGTPGNRGFGRVLRKRIRALVNREPSMIEKAITLAYLGSFLVDHIVNAEKTACRLIEGRALSELEEKNLWDSHYYRVIQTLASEHAEGPGIIDHMALLDNYSRLPGAIHSVRTRHWKLFDRVLARSIDEPDRQLDEANVLRKVQFILQSERSDSTKARLICIAASLLADRQCWCNHVPWNAAYTQIMTDFYPFLALHPGVLDKIVRLS